MQYEDWKNEIDPRLEIHRTRDNSDDEPDRNMKRLI